MLLPKKIIIFDEKTENNRFTGFNTDPNPVNLIDITPFAIFHDSGKRIWQPYIDRIHLPATEKPYDRKSITLSTIYSEIYLKLCENAVFTKLVLLSNTVNIKNIS